MDLNGEFLKIGLPAQILLFRTTKCTRPVNFLIVPLPIAGTDSDVSMNCVKPPWVGKDYYRVTTTLVGKHHTIVVQKDRHCFSSSGRDLLWCVYDMRHTTSVEGWTKPQLREEQNFSWGENKTSSSSDRGFRAANHPSSFSQSERHSIARENPEERPPYVPHRQTYSNRAEGRWIPEKNL